MLTATRLTYRINRFEIRAIVAAVALSAAVTAAILTWISSSGYAACVVIQSDPPPVACLNLMDAGRWATKIASVSSSLVPIFPYLAGTLLGGPVIARELDRGTARLAWSLGPSRSRWFAQRVLPVIGVTVAACLAIGLAGERIVAMFAPGTDLANSFVQFHQRGALIATNGFLIASVAVAVGALVGRTMPTLILALVLGGASLAAITALDHQILVAEAVPLPDNSANDYQVDSRFQLPDGRLVTWDELNAIDPTAMNADTGPPYPWVAIGIPGSRYREVEAREAAAQIVAGVVFLGLAAAVVARRRPG